MAATCASLFFIGITVGRMLNGFLTSRFRDERLIHFGERLIFFVVFLMAPPLGSAVPLTIPLFIGVGCAPVCPCLLHSTPAPFGRGYSESLVGRQLAASALGNCVLPSLFGLAANFLSISLLPFFIGLCLTVMALAHARLVKVAGK